MAVLSPTGVDNTLLYGATTGDYGSFLGGGSPVPYAQAGVAGVSNGSVVPVAAPVTTSGGGGSGVDPAAAAALAARMSSYGVTQDAIRASGQQSAIDTANTYGTNNRNFLTSYLTGVNSINNDEANNALNLRRSMASIANGVRTGLRSGGVQLANENALDSGAAEALARAWATVGNGQNNDANNAFALKNNDITTSLQNLNRTKDDTLTGFGQFRDAEVSRIGNDLQTKLAQLGSSAAAAGDSFGANTSIKDQIVADAIARLNAIDADRQSQLSTAHVLTPDEAAARAVQLDQAGAVGSSPFAINGPTVTAPTGQGADISQLPLFTARRRTT